MGIIKFLNTRLFAHEEESSQDFEKVKEVDNKITFSVSHLFGYDYLRSQWTKLTADTDGRLLVSSGATKTTNNTNSQVPVDTTVTPIASVRPNRIEVWIQNTGNEDVRVLFNDIIDDSIGIVLVPNQTFIIDTMSSALYAICDANSTTLNIIDIYTDS